MRRNHVEYLVDVLPSGGWFQTNEFDHLQLLDRVPLTTKGCDGIFLARVVDARFPDFEFPKPSGSVSVHPWLPPLAPGMPARWRNFRIAPDGGDAGVLRFHLDGRWEVLRAEIRGEGDCELALQVDGREQSRSVVGRAPLPLTTSLRDVQLLELRVTHAPAWLESLSFETGDHSPQPTGNYGSGFAKSGKPPHLGVQGDPAVDDCVQFVADHLPPESTSTILVSLASESRDMGVGRLLVALPPVATVEVVAATPTSGTAQLPKRLGTKAEALYAQIVCRRNGEIVAASAGLRIRLVR